MNAREENVTNVPLTLLLPNRRRSGILCRIPVHFQVKLYTTPDLKRSQDGEEEVPEAYASGRPTMNNSVSSNMAMWSGKTPWTPHPSI